MTWLPHPLQQGALAHPDRVALRIDSTSLTYEMLRDRVRAAAHRLRELGVERGHTVALIGPANAQWTVLFHAIGWCGAAVMPADKSGQLDCEHMVSSNEVMPVAQESSTEAYDAETWPLEQTRLVLKTSGSTGAPKLLRLSTAQLYFSAMGSAIRLGHHLDDVWLCALPLNHIGGAMILYRSLWYGITADIALPFDTERCAERLSSGEVTLVSLVPTMLQRLLDAEGANTFHPRLRVILVGGARCPNSLVEQARLRRLPVVLTWGMTEAASQAATQTPGDFEKSSDCGPALPFTLIETEGDRLVVDGPTTQGRLLTNDLGLLERGRVHVAGRLDDVIISGGKKISPMQIEAVIESWGMVHRILVVGLDDVLWGQRVCAVFTVEDGRISQGLFDELEALSSQHLEGYQKPKGWFAVSSIPELGPGKPDRSTTSIRLGQLKTSSAQPVEKGVWALAWREISDPNERMFLPDGTTEDTIIRSNHLNENGERACGESLDLQSGDETLSSSHGTTKGRISVNQRTPDTNVIENAVKVTKSNGEHLFETNMSVLKCAAIEDNASAVDFVESRRECVFEDHNQTSNGREANEND